MGQITRSIKAGGSTNIADGQTAVADDVNTDMNTVVTELNGLLDDENVKTATIPGAKSLRFTEIAAPSAPSANDILVYAKDSGGGTALFTQDSGGTEVELSFRLPRSYLAGLGTVTAADTDHDITIAVGAARDDTDATNLVLESALTKQIDAAWAVGTNQGGLDTGNVGNTTWYHLYLIKRTDTGVVDALFSTSATAPTMPANYTLKRRIAAFLTDGSANILGYYQVGDYFGWDDPPLDVSNDGTEAATLRTLSVPTGVRVFAVVNATAQTTTAGQVAYLSAPDANDEAPDNTAAPLATFNAGSAQAAADNAIVLTNTSAQIRSRFTGTLGTANFNLSTLGWYDRRGRDD